MGLPRTVTEWKINRAREIQSSLADGNHSGQSVLHEIGEPTAFEIIKSQEVPAPTRRSLRIENRQASRPGTSKGTRPSSILPTLTLSQSDSPPLVPTGNKGEACSLGNPDSTQNLSRRKSEGHSPEAFVFALQEPPMVGNKLVNIKNVIQIVDNKCLERNPPVTPRAALICSNHMNMWPITDLCTRDLAVGLVKGSNLGDIYVASLYCDGESPRAVPNEVRRLVNLAKKEKRQVLILMDSNSHSEALWSSKSTDNRGKQWEGYLSDNQQLLVANVGDNFTFMSHRGQTIIDVTLATPRLHENISQWGVVDSVPMSDHLSIEMILHLEGAWTPHPLVWNLSSKNFQKEQFISIMEEKSKNYKHDQFWEGKDLDIHGQALVTDMVEALDATAPLTRRSSNIARAGWFDTECKRLLHRCKQIRQYLRQWTRKHRRRGLPVYPNTRRYTWEDYIQVRRLFRKRCRRVKRKHYRRFIAGITDTEVIAKVSKKLDRNANAELSCFKHPSGIRCSPAETVEMLKNHHFPKSTKEPPDRVRQFLLGGRIDISDERADFISSHSVGICISSFKSHKAPGPDKLKIFPFKLLGPAALQRLVEIYKASYLLGAMPECFRLIQVVFIPKIGKVAFDVPNAHRPISLMNNIMKIPERLFLWRQEDTNLALQPLEREQHGFTKAKSCDSAITVVVSHIEHALMRDWFGAVAFLDFQGAYDGLQNSSMETALREMGADPHIISWYQDFFYHRKSRMSIKGITIELYHTQGAPQGGIGSPFLWAAVLNELIKIIKVKEQVKIVAYADDLCLISTGPDKNSCIASLQEAVNAVMSWAERHLLALSPTKSEIMLFTKKRRYPSIIESATRIVINGKPISYAVGAVRYLGVWLDRSLNWSEHIKIKTKKTKNLLHKLAGVSGDLWGYKPLIGKYCWEGLARPVLSFGCLGWIPAVIRNKSVDTKLTQVQRLGYKLMAFFRRSTPNKGLDMLFNIMPIKYHLLKTAASSHIRTISEAPFQWEELRTNVTNRVSHRTWMEEFLHDLDIDYTSNPLDSIPLQRKWTKGFLVDMESMNHSKAMAGKPLFLADLDAYTDGSKEIKEGIERTGAGFVVMKGKKMLTSGKRWVAHHYKLQARNTVFQAEIFAVKKLCELILSHTEGTDECWVNSDTKLDIYCDSQSSILALNSIFVQSELVMETIELLNLMASRIERLTIRWIRGHQRHIGNERADRMARRGRDGQAPSAPDSPKLAKATMKFDIEMAARRLWKMMWNMEPTCRQTKLWCPNGPRPEFAFEILRLPRPMCSQVIHFVTGHNFLRRHQAIIDSAELQKLEQHEGLGEDAEFHDAMEPIATCSLCGKQEESSYHIMTECQRLVTTRIGIFGREKILPPYDYIPVYKLIAYLRETKLKSLEMRPFVEEYKATELPERMPDWAKINDFDESSDDELQADTRYAKECGDKLLHQYLYQKYSAKKVKPPRNKTSQVPT